jgi:integrase
LKRAVVSFLSTQNGPDPGTTPAVTSASQTLPREDVKKEPRSFDDEEMRRIIAAAPEPLGTVVAITAVLGLRIGDLLPIGVKWCQF